MDWVNFQMNYDASTKALQAENKAQAVEIDEANRLLMLSGKTCNRLAAEIEKLRNPWISVDDALPNHETVVFVVGATHEPISAELRGRGINWFAYDSNDWIVGVTHWMPIPEVNKS